VGDHDDRRTAFLPDSGPVAQQLEKISCCWASPGCRRRLRPSRGCLSGFRVTRAARDLPTRLASFFYLARRTFSSGKCSGVDGPMPTRFQRQGRLTRREAAPRDTGLPEAREGRLFCSVRGQRRSRFEELGRMKADPPVRLTRTSIGAVGNMAGPRSTPHGRTPLPVVHGLTVYP